MIFEEHGTCGEFELVCTCRRRAPSRADTFRPGPARWPHCPGVLSLPVAHHRPRTGLRGNGTPRRTWLLRASAARTSATALRVRHRRPPGHHRPCADEVRHRRAPYFAVAASRRSQSASSVEAPLPHAVVAGVMRTVAAAITWRCRPSRARCLLGSARSPSPFLVARLFIIASILRPRPAQPHPRGPRASRPATAGDALTASIARSATPPAPARRARRRAFRALCQRLLSACSTDAVGPSVRPPARSSPSPTVFQ